MRNLWFLGLLLLGGTRQMFLDAAKGRPYPESYRKYAQNWEQLAEKWGQFEGLVPVVVATVKAATMDFRRLPRSLTEACQSRWVPVECKHLRNPLLGTPLLDTPMSEAGAYGVQVQNDEVRVWRRELDGKGGLRQRVVWRASLREIRVSRRKVGSGYQSLGWRQAAPLGLVLAHGVGGVVRACLDLYFLWQGRPAQSLEDIQSVCSYLPHLRNGYRGGTVRFLEFQMCADPTKDTACGATALKRFLEENHSPGDVVLIFQEPGNQRLPGTAEVFVEGGLLPEGLLPIENNPYLAPVQ